MGAAIRFRLCRTEARAILEVCEELSTFREGDGPALQTLAEPLRDLLQAEHFLTYQLVAEGSGVELGCLHGCGFDFAQATQLFAGFAAATGAEFCAYNPLKPEPWQRDRALLLPEIVGQLSPAQDRFQRGVEKVFGTTNQLRALVCDGSSLLAWVGILQPDPFVFRQRVLLDKLLKPMQKRLIIERMLGDAAGTRAALDAALEAISAPTFLLGANGAIRHANAPGIALLAADSNVAATLGEQVLRPSPLASARITPIRSPAGSIQYLAVLRDQPATRIDGAISRAATAWRLTRRQADVLRLLVDGHSNTGICAHLGIASRTVEDHIRVMFEKAGAGSRTELVAKALRGVGGT